MNIECNNCHKLGHYKCDCWDKEGQSPRFRKGLKGKSKSVSASAVDNKVIEGAWMAMMENPLVETSGECDFIELGASRDEGLAFPSAETDVLATIEPTTTTTSNNSHILELYDSRASQHMTPYLHLLQGSVLHPVTLLTNLGQF